MKTETVRIITQLLIASTVLILAISNLRTQRRIDKLEKIIYGEVTVEVTK